MEEGSYSEVPVEFPRRRRRCCGQNMKLVLLGLATATVWAGLLSLLLLWHWDTVQSLKQLKDTAAQNVSQVSKALKQHQGDQMAQKSQATQISQNMEEIRAELRRMKSQDTELSHNLDVIVETLSNLKSLGLNERQRAFASLERLQVEVEKLWVELRVSSALALRDPPLGSRVTVPPAQVMGVTPADTAPTVRTTAPPTPAVRSTAPPTPAVHTTAPPTPAVRTTAPPTPAMRTTAPPTPAVHTTAPPTATVHTTAPPTPSVRTTAPPMPTVRTTAPPTPAVRTTAPPTSSGSLCDSCPEHWVYFQQKCYYFGEGTKKWIQARFECRSLEGQLVSIHSQEEQDFLTKHASKKGSWIGLRDLDIEGEFVWMDGTTPDYSNWRPGEPNNGGQGEDCVMMQGSGQWNDAYCRGSLDNWVCDRLATC